MQKPNSKMKEITSGIIGIKNFQNNHFGNMLLSNLLEEINSSGGNEDNIAMTAPFFESSSVLESNIDSLNRIVTININQLNEKNYLIIRIQPLNEIELCVKKNWVKKELFLLKEYHYYKNKIKKNNSFEKITLLNKKISSSEIRFLYSFETTNNFDLYFLSFVSSMLRDLHIQRKAKIANESDFKFLYSIIGKNYDNLTYNQLKDLIQLMDIRLGSLTKESKELIELNHSF